MLRLAFSIAVLFAAFIPTFALAQQPKLDQFGQPIVMVGKFEIVEARGQRYRELTERDYRHILTLSPPKGFVFAVVELLVRFEKDPTKGSAEAPLALVGLTIGDETLNAVGSLERTTSLSRVYGLSVSNIHDTGKTSFEPVFVVPESSKKGTLRIGDQLQVDVEFDGEVADLPDPAERFAIKIVSAKRVDGIRDRDSFIRGDERFLLDYVWRSRADIVTIEFELTARVPTTSNAFFALPSDFRIDLGQGLTLPALGKHDSDTIYPGMKLTEDAFSMVRSELNEDGTFTTGTASYAFQLPKGATKGKLLYHGAPVAEFVVE